MPDMLQNQPLNPSEGRGSSPQTYIAVLQARETNPNGRQSTALQGATLAFATRTEKTPAEAPAASSCSDGARKASLIAGAVTKVHPGIQEDLSTDTVRRKIQQFSAKSVTGSHTSVASSNSQYIAAHLAADRSKARAVLHPLSLPSRRATNQRTRSLERGNVGSVSTSQSVDAGIGLSAHHDSDRPNKELEERNTLLAHINHSRSSTQLHENANPPGSDTMNNLRGSPEKKPTLPPRIPEHNTSNKASSPPLPMRGATLAEAEKAGQLSHLPDQRSQSNAQGPKTATSLRASSDDVRVASSLASSRAPTPSKTTTPPPPSPHRRTRSRSLLIHPPVSQSNPSRTPSPTKGLRQTMRIESKSDNEGERSRSHHSRPRMIRPHPYKHSEGSRRWQDRVTEPERKRYEGVWAANKGLLFQSDDGDLQVQDKVVNVVVRDIWLRSRLPPSLLARIWDLVSHDAEAMALSREEFVVGMWLIDQSLRGCKLPPRVSDSVWESVRATTFDLHQPKISVVDIRS